MFLTIENMNLYGTYILCANLNNNNNLIGQI